MTKTHIRVRHLPWGAIGTVAAVVLIGAGFAFTVLRTSAALGPYNGTDGVQDTSPNVTCGTDTASGTSDNAFGQGSKDDIDPPTVVAGSIPPNKSDLSRFCSGFAQSGHSFLYLYWERTNVLGTANFSFEYNQSATLSSNGVTPVRMAGDLLILYDFAKSGNQLNLNVSMWVTSGAGSLCEKSNATPCWGTASSLNAAGVSEGAINADQLRGEAVIDLTASGIIGAGQCVAFNSNYVKGRSSAAFGSELKDFIAPIPANINTCGGITIHKVTDPSPDSTGTSFGYTTSGTGLSGFSLGDGGTKAFSSLAPCATSADCYAVAETDPTSSGFDFVSLVCTTSGTGTSATVDNATRSVSIHLGDNGTVDCTYTNRMRGHILIDKVTDPSGDPTAFTFTPSYNGGATFNLSDGDPANDSGAIVPGTYSVSESVPAGWTLTSATCSDGSPVTAIVLGAGETVTCTFVNTKLGHIIVDKVTAPAGSTQSFTFTPSYNGGATFALTDGATPNDSGAIAPGTYSVSEAALSGWTLVSATCSDGSPVTAIVLSAGETVTCTFTNTPLYKLIVVTCDTSTETLVVSRVTQDGVVTETISSVPAALAAKGVTEADLCALGGATYDDLPGGTYAPSAEVPKP